MRIISGSSGGIPLRVPKTVLRPTTDRTRSAVFSMLADRVVEARVADLFAGSGAYGLECLSRGARRAVFVDDDRLAIQTITANLEKSKLGASAELICAKVDSWWTRPQPAFDLIFADPPYKKLPDDRDWNPELFKSPFLRALLAPGAILVLESWAHAHEPTPPPDWNCLEDRRYGAARIRFLTPATKPSSHE